ncbi:TolC family protein [Haliscomenobacter hydrossis]|uniref:Outer membrane efflux protein n=1 Tax=Haliscomenobacter hydrossis (strain ATCC 27775 / DSM 1100 / LMG 10767 / O) TaxID=760192 RepID=F4KVG7_HALH1|nr:TolC family protein [Haliscomenobacter hydrossis]AEE51280.1 outer membrane efflux protein [Haliscomenobacter hydrossis DSM 1100]
MRTPRSPQKSGIIRLFLFPLLLLPLIGLYSQSNPLDAYIQEAINNSHALKEKQFVLERNLFALEEAKRLYYPTVNFNASYTLAAGGRRLEFPIGDLLNPVYSTLNEMTNTNNFPQVDNVNELLAPNNFYDVKVRAQQPIVNAEIKLNRSIKTAQVSLQEIDMQVYRRELAKNVKLAYYQYLQAREAVLIYQNATQLLQESKRVNESLVRNDKAVPSVISRANSEIAAVEAQAVEARNQQRNAAAYFNHLLGRSLDQSITIDTIQILQGGDRILVSEQEGRPFIFENREEIAQLNKAQEINRLLVNLEETYRKPKIGAQLDVGSQAFGLEVGPYALLGVSLEIPLWTANRNKLQVQQAASNVSALNEQIAQVKDQIQLQIRIAQNAVQAEQEILQSYNTQQDAARQYYRDTFRRYKEGVANYIELLDARTQITNLDVRRSIAYYNVLMRRAELERALAAYPIK